MEKSSIQADLTVASRDYPFDSELLLINPENQDHVIARVNDNPPTGETLVISEQVADALDIKNKGTAKLQVGQPLPQADKLAEQANEVITIQTRQEKDGSKNKYLFTILQMLRNRN